MRRAVLVTSALAVVLVAAAAGLVWAAFAGVGPADEDAAALSAAIDVRSGGLTTAAVVVTNLGSTLSMGVVALVAGALLVWRGRRFEGIWLVGTALTASAVFTLVKRFLDRPRPPAAVRLLDVGNESLPSGHATMAVAVIGALVVLAWPHLAGGSRVLVAVAAVVWVVLVGLTRVYLGVHWWSDVLAGWATGAAWLAVCTGLLLRARSSRS
ncbi:phosphatase PAP2 family protein [Pseudonocardia ailaonensis]|uniref:phosphatase PAP2 family protein n=1 Tax=Pseudonocardia ailaonensis TaxID=367279 RepID=UPI0031E098E3